jgi:streptothricin acetyltransferase
MDVEEVSRLSRAEISHCDFSFDVTHELVTPYSDPFVHVRPTTPYRKAYTFDDAEFMDIGPDRMLAVARDAGRVRGYILVSKSWNNYALVDDFAVDRTVRGSGVGRRLMDRAVLWTEERDLPGMRLETQTNNVPACRFYRRYGFELGGYDEHLYGALADVRAETALFWYLFLKG